ncbi:unnamed protein product [Medioppia subpectinata]|uniref:Uncharacterized protein n=1 Tax=Medioppia subpectinata TaxID=1979941 RepID=A0A7R9KB69_9ACAR|nr:unnamed protein product [Medioppia subpectinata]CAG2100238.1 unnamed protein product [Medioppia subpectinata]
MLDNFLGNVFGRSKKSTNASGAGGGGPTHTTGADNDSFVVLPPNGPIDGHTTDDHSLYPRMGTLLTQEMIVNSNSQSAGQPSSSSLAPTVAQRTCAQTYSSPIDNIPFTTLMSGSGNDWLVDNNQRALNKSFETIDRIQQYLSTASQSEYSFHLENNILSESLLQS